MKQLNMPAMISLLLVTVTGSARAQATADFESVHATSQNFVAAIRARDIEAMDKVWRHESYASFIGPLSTTVVVGWEGVRKAWQMRFGQFDRVTISMNDPHVHINGCVGCGHREGRVAAKRRKDHWLRRLCNERLGKER